MKKEFVKITKVATWFNVSHETIKNWLKNGLIEKTKYNSYCKFDEEDYEIFKNHILEKYNLKGVD